MKPKSITSTANATVKEAARLKRKKHRYARRLFLAEGEDLLEAAIESGRIPRQVFVLEGTETAAALPERVNGGSGCELFSVSGPVMGKLSSMGGNSRVVAVFDFVDTGLPEAAAGAAGFYLYLAGLGDPGNVGSIIRSAAALGGAGVILSPDTADPYSSRAVQASMGALFGIPLSFNQDGISSLLYWAADRGLTLAAADHRQGQLAWECDLTGNFLLMLGSERSGLPQGIKEHAIFSIRIPQHPGAESLNVAMAATVIMYEAVRQRSGIAAP